MKARITVTLVCSALVLGLTGCVTYTKTLTNAQGQTQTCSTKAWIGPVAQVSAHYRQKDCIDKAKANGFEEEKSAAKS
jgi:starvation-inducible outer membrane lipoprotein